MGLKRRVVMDIHRKKYFQNFATAFFFYHDVDLKCDMYVCRCILYKNLENVYIFTKSDFDTQVCLYVSLNHTQIYFMEFLSKNIKHMQYKDFQNDVVKKMLCQNL